MRALYDPLVVVHAIAGALSLLALPLPLVTRKGSRLHRRAGEFFVRAMAVVAISGLLISAIWLCAPLVVMKLPAEISEARLAIAERSTRAYGLFFATVGAMTGTAVWQGKAALRRRPATRIESRSDRLLPAATVMLGAALLLTGVLMRDMLFVGFGALAAWGGRGDLQRARQGFRTPRERILGHLQAMLGGATAAVTAFCVLVLRRQLPHLADYDLWFWFVPVTLGVGGSVLWSRVWRRRLG